MHLVHGLFDCVFSILTVSQNRMFAPLGGGLTEAITVSRCGPRIPLPLENFDSGMAICRRGTTTPRNSVLDRA